jgi:GT2 family glycosyltransferase
MTTFVVTLNWNSTSETLDLLRSLEGRAVVVIVDNGSQQAEVEDLQGFCASREGFHVVELVQNAGFAAGTNVGLRWVLDRATPSDVVAIINNDAVVWDGAIERLARAVTEDAQLISVAPVLYDHRGGVWYGGGTVDRRWCRVHVKRSEPSTDGLMPTGFVTLAFAVMSVRRLREVGLLDERYFFGQEEWDYSVRCSALGDLAVDTGSKSYHGGDGSHHNQDALFVYNGYRNRITFARRWKRPLPYLSWLTIFAAFLVAIRPLQELRRAGLPAYVFAVKLGLRVLIDGAAAEAVTLDQLRNAGRALGSEVVL